MCSLINGEVARITATRINHLATRDKLTGLLNRNTIECICEDMLRTGKIPFTLIMFDLNAFKAINDNAGHLKGDEVLVQVAEAMRRYNPDNAYASRWGGDEFMILVPGDDSEEVDRITTGISDELDGVIGFEYGTSVAQADDSLDMLVHRADTGMYSKKRNRRATDMAVA